MEAVDYSTLKKKNKTKFFEYLLFKKLNNLPTYEDCQECFNNLPEDLKQLAVETNMDSVEFEEALREHLTTSITRG